MQSREEDDEYVEEVEDFSPDILEYPLLRIISTALEEFGIGYIDGVPKHYKNGYSDLHYSMHQLPAADHLP